MLLFLPAVVFGLEPLGAILRETFTSDGTTLTTVGGLFVYGGLLALPLALVISLLPLRHKGPDGKRRLPPWNVAVAVVALVLLLPLIYELGKDFYRCDVLRIPNCD